MKRRVHLTLLLALLICLTAACGKASDSGEASVTSEEASNGAVDGSSLSEEDTMTEGTKLNHLARTYLLKDLDGAHSNTVLKDDALTLEDGATSGSFVVPLEVEAFSTMIGSWDASTSDGSRVEMSVSFETEGGAWSDYLSWGIWSSALGVSASPSSSDEYGAMNVDTLTVNSGYRATGKIKVKLDLQRGGKAPSVRAFTLAAPQFESSFKPTAADLPAECLNDVPMRSQLAEENGSDGNRICSPTTTVMALEYMGTKLGTMTAAKGIYDNGWNAYGNWSYAVAYACEKGYTSHLDLYDRDMMKYALSQGYVIGCSTMLTSSGHIVLLVGYTVIDGEEYYICNDPNVDPSDPTRTNYKMDYFEDRWFRDDMGGLGVVYVFGCKGEA